jgi:translin
MGKITENLDIISEEIRKIFTARDEAREKVIPLSRETIHYCSVTIRAVHRQEFAQAAELLKTAADLLNQAKQGTAGFDELANAGYLRDAEKEFVEASTLVAMVGGLKLPGPDDLHVDPAAYLNGLAEAATELRRYLLDGIRHGDLTRGEELLDAMDDIYSVLVTMDFPDAITGGLRRTTDVVRGVLEKTRSDFTLIGQQKYLERKLEKFEEINEGNKQL